MLKLVFVTRKIPEVGLALLREKGYALDISDADRPLAKKELIAALKTKPYDGVLCLLTDTIDAEVFDAVPTAKIFANYAVGLNNIDVAEAKKRGIAVTNTPDVLTNAVAEHAFALMLALARRIVEADSFTRAGKYTGWDPHLLVGFELKGKTLGVLGAGRIGARVIEQARAFGMKVLYYDVKQNPALEETHGTRFCATPEEVLKAADAVSIHVPLLPSTRHFIDANRLRLMKKTAILINTSRGSVVDEAALVSALQEGILRGAALDVFENEPALARGLTELPNVILTPHIASATEEARGAMSVVAAENLIAFFEERTPPNMV
ncbi:MAG: D-isomer specific 2-hydroxyacid dehydrogenase [Parcubacteria group bacterium Greene0416_79]|nr:MAG: D-isomer specific 2-hydroxyacid dehydrogenase [Parcubacteria group bacterium Greene0416_79]